MISFFMGSIRKKLIFLVFMSMLPCLLIIIHSGFENKKNEIERAEHEVLHLVRGMVNVQEQITSFTSQILESIVQISIVQEQNTQACNKLFKRLIALNIYFKNIAMTDKDGNVLAASLPFGDVNLSDRKHFVQARDSLEFATGEFITTRMSPEQAFPFAQPIINSQGEFLGVVTTVISLDVLWEIFPSANLPQGSFVDGVDHEGVRLFRIPEDRDHSVGDLIDENLWDAMLSAHDGENFDQVVEYDHQVLAVMSVSLRDSYSPYMYLTVSIPRKQLLKMAYHVMYRNIALLSLAAAFAFMTAWFVGESAIVKKIRSLRNTSEKIAQGNFNLRTGLDDDKSEIGDLARSFDVMARRLSDEIIEQKYIQEQLSQVVAEKDRFMSIIAHDLKSPMAGLLSLSQLLADEHESFNKDELKSVSYEMKKSAERVYRLLENLLEWSRIKQGRMDFVPVKTSLDNHILANIFLYREVAAQKEITLEYDTQENVYVDADLAMLNSILRNLISNAIKFSKRKSQVKINVQEKNSMVQVSIADHGIGMAADDIRDLFALDRKKSTQGTEGERGTGLGLILCKEFVEKHGGQIWAESRLGQGTTFYFTLPAVTFHQST